ncbi:MAG: flagellar motor protein MotB [Proteobacteria bacterium]|nr:flagellar motor protein MotB [Pseudomonadota bacterium]
MADNKSNQSIIIKKIKKGGHAAHGGAWKIAYADFVTAMMAFFLLLWLLNSVTQEQLQGISNYFAPVSVAKSESGSGDILAGKTMTEEGVAKSSTSKDSVVVNLPPPKAGTGGEEASEKAKAEPTEEEVEEERKKVVEQEQLEKAQEEMEQNFAKLPQIKELAESLLIDNTPEGLRIQLLDKDGLPMFKSGRAEMLPHAQRLIQLVSKVIVKMPQQISISGHTDSKRFISDDGYSNWELSADRANAARREIVFSKVPFERVSRVVGMAASEPFLPKDPENARNRRLSIILLRGTGKDNPAAKKEVKKEIKKKNKIETGLPGLENIKDRQEKEGLNIPTPPKAEARKPGAVIKKKTEPTLEIKVAPVEEAPSLPGLESIKDRQTKEGIGKPAKLKTKPGVGFDLPVFKKAIKPNSQSLDLPKEDVRPSLPGLDALRKKQLDGAK